MLRQVTGLVLPFLRRQVKVPNYEPIDVEHLWEQKVARLIACSYNEAVCIDDLCFMYQVGVCYFPHCRDGRYPSSFRPNQRGLINRALI